MICIHCDQYMRKLKVLFATRSRILNLGLPCKIIIFGSLRPKFRTEISNKRITNGIFGHFQTLNSSLSRKVQKGEFHINFHSLSDSSMQQIDTPLYKSIFHNNFLSRKYQVVRITYNWELYENAVKLQTYYNYPTKFSSSILSKHVHLSFLTKFY